MEIISTPTDFLGINIYSGNLVKIDNTPGSEAFKEIAYPEGHPKTAMGWDIDPRCIYYGLKFPNEIYNIPKFYIGENGCAFNDTVSNDGEVHDDYRINYLRDHFISAHRAITDGINLAGYFVWSLMDNFEWLHGYSKRFGIIFTDHSSQKRILKKSALWYKAVIEKNRLFC